MFRVVLKKIIERAPVSMGNAEQEPWTRQWLRHGMNRSWDAYNRTAKQLLLLLVDWAERWPCADIPKARLIFSV